jgi:hypothetical protein
VFFDLAKVDGKDDSISRLAKFDAETPDASDLSIRCSLLPVVIDHASKRLARCHSAATESVLPAHNKSFKASQRSLSLVHARPCRTTQVVRRVSCRKQSQNPGTDHPGLTTHNLCALRVQTAAGSPSAMARLENAKQRQTSAKRGLAAFGGLHVQAPSLV